VSPLLLGRKNECQVLDDFLAATRKGDGGAIVVHGDPGMGKTALLEYAVASAREFDVFRTVGNEAEMELPYAALHQLCRLGLGEVGGLARLQRDALEVVLGRREGAAPANRRVSPIQGVSQARSQVPNSARQRVAPAEAAQRRQFVLATDTENGRW
jgi:AAA ATPase domain